MVRGYSKKQIDMLKFPIAQYEFPTGDGEFTGKLVMKKWSDKRGLICYFDTYDGQMYKICVWFKSQASKSYRPKKSDMDISMVEIGTELKVTFETNKNSKTVWLNAQKILN